MDPCRYCDCECEGCEDHLAFVPDIEQRLRCEQLQREIETSKRETFETAVELRGALDSIASLERQLTAARERIDVLLDHGLGDVERAKCVACHIHSQVPDAFGLCLACDREDGDTDEETTG